MDEVTTTATILCATEAATAALGRTLGGLLVPGDIIGLCGDLGAGKTTFARAIARGAGVADAVPVNSPTFTIYNLYQGQELRICHLDLYRLGDAQELEGIGLDELLDGSTALVVEWFDLFPEAFLADHLRVAMTHTGATSRHLVFTANLEAGAELLAELMQAAGAGG